jgi:molybdopterin-containing oxidoreductase family iron-sulfur binding subunit
MKTIPPPYPEPDVGPKYWRSLDQLADTPEFRQWVEREFPAGASEFTDPVSRRHFVKIMSASFLLAGLGGTGCRRPVETILPFAQQPENYVHGVPQFFATAMPMRGSAIPLVVKSHDGRPTKIEGNALHPDSNGGTDRYVQASILNLYDPDRAMRFTRDGTPVAQEAVFDALADISRKAQQSGGEGLSFLVERSSSPSRARLQRLIKEKFPKAKWHAYEPVDFALSQATASNVYGQPVAPRYELDKAKVILSLDCDFIGAEEEAYRHIRSFAKGRKISKPGDSMSRLYVIEPLMTLTGTNADHRYRLPSSAIAKVAAQLAAEVLNQANLSNELTSAVKVLAEGASSEAKWVTECAADLLKNRGNCLVLAGHRQPPSVHTIAHALNAALGSVGNTVVYQDASDRASDAAIEALADDLNAGHVDTRVILGGNPVYNAPTGLAWEQTQRKAKSVVRLGYYEDETFAACNWHLPAAHYLESWGDARTTDGTLVPIQPLIDRLFGGLTEIEVLARIAGETKTSPYEIVRETFRTIAGDTDDEAKWRKCLHDGFLAGSATKPITANFNWATAAKVVGAFQASPLPDTNNLEVIFHRDHSVDDGRYNNNGWLQEMPDPISKVTWENVILLSAKTARDHGVYFRDKEGNELWVPVAKVQLGGREIEGPVWISPGQADNTIGLALGYGRTKTGRVGRSSGFNAYALRASSASFAVGAKLASAGRTHQIACTQNHWSMEGRPIIREANLKQFEEHPDFAKSVFSEQAPDERPLYPNPLDKLKEKALHHWGMSIDLNSCVGCQACVMACQSENNIPIVGKKQVGLSREMHWLRIDRYYTADPAKPQDEQISDPQVVYQPMLCQHCEAAPCENVCPVNATVHDEEGLNLMVYNRCVGTRYCSNNCPYKVRRFNYFDWNRRPLDHLYKSPMTSFTDGEWELKRWYKNPDKGSRRDDEWELIKLVKNPDVTVRMRGVMEKCTFCVQRIEQAKIAQKVKAGASPNIEVPDGTIKTACQQACPAEAIAFGNVGDPNSAVSKLKAQQRNYAVLDFLSTKPRLTYLARVRNPNPAMPGAYDVPLSTKEFLHKNPPVHGSHQPHGTTTEKGAH